MIIENFEKLDFNRKVDVLVAVHVFDIKSEDIYIEWHPFHNLAVGSGYWSVYYNVPMKNMVVATNVQLYSTLLTSAWDLVRKFEYMYLFRAKEIKNGNWEAKLVWDDKRTYLYGWGETEMLALCYAGLKAVGFPLVEFLKNEGKVEERIGG